MGRRAEFLSRRSTTVAWAVMLLLLLASWTPANALLLLSGDRSALPSSDGRMVRDQDAWVRISLISEDDPQDSDQVINEPDRVILEISNQARRHLGVYIERSDETSRFPTYIDNGSNDLIIGPIDEATSYVGASSALYDAVTSYFGSEETQRIRVVNRRYLLPIPRNGQNEVEPGREYSFAINTGGNGWGKPPPVDPNSRLDRNSRGVVLLAATTSFLQLTALNLADAFMPVLDIKSLRDLAIDLVPQALVILKNYPALVNYYNRGQWPDFYRTLVLAIYDSPYITQAIVAVIKRVSLEASEQFVEAVTGMTLISSGFSLADLIVTKLENKDLSWTAPFNVSVTRPRVDSVSEENAQGRVTIKGAGFDPYRTTNNEVYVSAPLGWKKAAVVSVPDEGTLIAVVPSQVEQTPTLKVCDRGLIGYLEHYCSNDDVGIGGNPTLSVSLSDQFGLAIDNGATVSDTFFVKGRLRDPPASVNVRGLVADLKIDGKLYAQKTLTDVNFEFQVNTDTLAAGSHTAVVEMRISSRDARSNILTFVTTGILPEFEAAAISFHSVTLHWRRREVPGGDWYYYSSLTDRRMNFEVQQTGREFRGEWDFWDDDPLHRHYSGSSEIVANSAFTAIERGTIDWNVELSYSSGTTFEENFGLTLYDIPLVQSGESGGFYRFRVEGNAVCAPNFTFLSTRLEDAVSYRRDLELVKVECDQYSFLDVHLFPVKGPNDFPLK
jgi:hypothetical protein